MICQKPFILIYYVTGSRGLRKRMFHIFNWHICMSNDNVMALFRQKRHLTKLVFLSVYHQMARPTRDQFVDRREKAVQNATIVTGTKTSPWNISSCHAQSLKKSDPSSSVNWEANLRLSARGAFRCGRDSQPAAQPASRRLFLELKVLVPWRTKP